METDAYRSDGRLANTNLHARTCLHTSKDIYKLQHLPPLLPLQTVMHSNTTKPFESKITIWIPDIVIRGFLKSSRHFSCYLEIGPVPPKGRKMYLTAIFKIQFYYWLEVYICKRATMIRHFWHHYINCWFTGSISIHKPLFDTTTQTLFAK